MEIILLSDVDNVGQAGDIITVKPGFARNKLIPQGLALRASKRNVALAKEKKKVASVKLERETHSLELLAKKLSNVEITIEVKVGEEEKMFGSITNKDIHKELIAKGFELEKNHLEKNYQFKILK